MPHNAILFRGIVIAMFSSMIADRIIHTCQAVGVAGQVSMPDIGRIMKTLAWHLPLS